ncbi:trypsin-like isoform X2 [Physella acuta]|nr:trypsin-like isoform X2 [Physella acuta]
MRSASVLCPLLALCLCVTVSGMRLQSRLTPRVIGGTEVVDRCKSPYNAMVALQFTSPTGPVTFCSAVMLTDTILVTSAYCVYQFLALKDIPIKAIVGERDMFMTDRDEQVIDIDSVKVHRMYNDSTLDNNVGLVRLVTPARLSDCVQPAVKMEADPAACNDVDKTCVMVGWGPYAENSKPTNSRLPRYANITVLGNFLTNMLSYQLLRRGPPTGTLLAEPSNPNTKACFFDWGGLVSCQRNGKSVLRGVIGEHNCNTEVGQTPPILVSDIPTYQPWIDSCISSWNSCLTL